MRQVRQLASVWEFELDITQEVLRILDEVLSLNGRAKTFTGSTPLLGAIPELDSMAVVTLITTLEEQFGLVVDDDDIDGSNFATVGSLTDFVNSKLAGVGREGLYIAALAFGIERVKHQAGLA